MRVLFLTHRLPYAPNRGDRVRAFFLLRALSQFADVDVVSLVHSKDEAAKADVLRGMASHVDVARVPTSRNMLRSVMALPTTQPLTHTMLDSPELSAKIGEAIARRPPDLVLAYCSGMARFALQPPLAALPMVLDMVDVDSAKWAALAETAPAPLSWVYRREARVLRRFEAIATRRARATLVVTPGERITLATIAPGARIEVVSNGVDVDFFRPQCAAEPSSTVVFCGVMNYAPNENAAVLLARRVWPLVRERRADAKLQIVGSHPSRAVRALTSPDSGVEVTGEVADVRPFLRSAAAAAAPLLTARGIQNKVLEAVASGLPVLVTSNVFDSLPVDIRPACVRADSAQSMADAVVDLLSLSPFERRAMAERAAIGGLNWARQLASVRSILVGATTGALDSRRDVP